MGTDNPSTELAQVSAAQAGDLGAVEQLLMQNWSWLKALVAGIVRNRADTDDVLQEICIKVIRKIGTLKQQESFRPWVACLARREALRWRNLNMRRGISLDHENAEEPPDPKALSVDEQLAEDEERAQVLDAIAQLPRKYKEVLLLYHSGQTYKQIAETLELTMTTVQIRIVRARRMIMDTINEQLSRRIQHESARRPSRAAHP